MRTGGCTIQQALTTEAASVVKQAVVLAKRRGHAQVTPLHVANTMLASSAGLFRTACLQSHSHPLQCKALELCFNVALNRLPTSSNSSPILGPHHHHHHHQSHHPSISNALVAAFKRAQAHQRRGSIENQQQPLLATKIDLEQLIISILDDPSVSRVMREAGFSSTQVKSNVEQAVSLELCSQNPSPSSKSKENKNQHVFLSHHQSGGLLKASNKLIKDEDVMSVVESLMNKKRKSIVIVGECLDSLEGVIKGVMDKVDSGDVNEALKEIKLISVPLSTFANIQREEVEQRIGELTCLVKSLVAKGVVLYLGDLKWISDYRANNSGQGKLSYYYCSVEHMIMELGRLVCSIGENGKFWLVGIATFQTYMRCKNGHNSLESIWNMHPITIPAGSLGLSLNSDTQLELRSKTSCENGSSWMIVDSGDQEKQLTCCVDCKAKFEVEALSLQNSASKYIGSTLSNLPSWLKDERQRLNTNHHDQKCESIKELCKKWNAICNSSQHKQAKTFERSLTFPSTSHSQLSFLDQETSLRIYIPEHQHTPFSSNPNSTPNSASSSDIMEIEYIPKFKEFNSENLNILSNALEEKVPWQKDIIREIVGTILQCRSGMIKRKEKSSRNDHHELAKEETWLFFQGYDVQAKEKIARELAKVVFGSYLKFKSIALSSFYTDKDFRNKRSRDEQSCSYMERFSRAVSSNPHRVFFVEDVEQVDYFSQRGIKKAIESGKFVTSDDQEVSLSDSIIILSCERFSSRSRAVSPLKYSSDGSDNEETRNVSLDLNISIDDHDQESIDDIRLLESVDRCVSL